MLTGYCYRYYYRYCYWACRNPNTWPVAMTMCGECAFQNLPDPYRRIQARNQRAASARTALLGGEGMPACLPTCLPHMPAHTPAHVATAARACPCGHHHVPATHMPGMHLLPHMAWRGAHHTWWDAETGSTAQSLGLPEAISPFPHPLAPVPDPRPLAFHVYHPI